ncbi:S24 family peptidase [Neorhizobium lilium]|uniref:S24 family peptidase n=1 Tax=Neorhizobium lilium TaxID=2503024 RepID=A0A444LGP6_9HYPH|nr:S24 family peptidase [Neorhizobium lilium]RWX77240.1 S24 family peptidase [Neorhizobium lilium]
MKLDARLARTIPARLKKFTPHWSELDETRHQVCGKAVILVELVGGREKAAALLDVSDNTIDNHRKGIGDVSHTAFRQLTEKAGLPQACLYFRWSVENGELLFADGQGNVYRDPAELDRPQAQAPKDEPTLVYVRDRETPLRPAGLAEEDDFIHLSVPLDYLGRLQVDPRDLLAMVATDHGMAPEVEEEALLLVDTADRELSDGCLYVLNAGNGAIIRRVRHLPKGSLELLSGDSERYPPQRIKKTAIPGLGVVGRLRSHSRGV